MLSLQRLPRTLAFQDNQEYSYFQYFRQNAALDISSHFDRGLFSHVIIQASWNEPSLCQLIASVGALYKADAPKSANQSKNDTATHRQYAFYKYGQALKRTQTRISVDQCPNTTRVALIASLLIYCFENLNGDIDSALRHLESALKLMQRQLAQSGGLYKHSKNSAPTPHLDDNLVGAFFRLNSGLLSRDNISEAGNIGSRLDIHFLEDICEVPEILHSIAEARNNLESIQFPTIPSLARDLAQFNELPLFKEIDEELKSRYTTLSSQLHQWNVAFAPLYSKTLTSEGKKDFASAATLRVRALSTELAVRRACAGEQRDLHALDIECRETIHLSRLVARDPGFLKSFVWDCGIVPGLTIVIASCINTSIREEALQVLKDIVPRREGAWDSVTAVKFGEYCLQMSKS
jgi:hypothetical protein